MSAELGQILAAGPPAAAQLNDLKENARQIKDLTTAIAKDQKDSAKLLRESAEAMADSAAQTAANFLKELETSMKLLLFGAAGDPTAKELT